MAMLQYRHKSRAWRQMVTTDTAGNVRAIKDQIALGIAEGDQGAYDRGRGHRCADEADGCRFGVAWNHASKACRTTPLCAPTWRSFRDRCCTRWW